VPLFRLHNPLGGPDLTAFVRSGLGPLGALPYRPEVSAEVICDFSPIAPRVRGRLLTWSRPSETRRDDREVAISLGLPGEWREQLRPGFEFKLFQEGLDEPIGIGVIKELFDPFNTRYEADAEVTAAFFPGATLQKPFSGSVCDFRIVRLGSTWRGHLDNSVVRDGHVLQPGCTFLCLHHFAPSRANPTAEGQSLVETDSFEISVSGTAVGHGVVTGPLPPASRILLCAPVWASP
jgi:hypothetical protein